MRPLWRSVESLGNTIKKMQDENFDCIIVFDGRRGLGKSTGAIKLALQFEQFDMKNDIIFSRDDVLKAIATKKNSVIIADEMINVAHNRDFYDEQQKKLIRFLNMYRDSKNVLICCVPNFADLDKQLRMLIKYRINVVTRGMAVIHTQKRSAYATDAWDIKYNEKIEQSWIKKGVIKPRYQKLTTFHGLLRYGALGIRQQSKYDSIKQEKRNILVFEKASIEFQNKAQKRAVLLEETYQGIINNTIPLSETVNIAIKNDLSPMSFLSLLQTRARIDGIKLKPLSVARNFEQKEVPYSKNSHEFDQKPFPISTDAT